jgi:tetratricopeptide (TPR) repeat protein
LLLAATVSVGEQTGPDTRDMLAEAISHYDNGDFDSATELLEQVLKIEPRNGTAAYELALSHQANGNLQGCVDVARKYLRKLRKDEGQADLMPQLSMLQASCHSEAGESRDALKVFRAGLERNPGDYGLNFNISITLLRLGEIEEAISYLQRAIEANPNHPSPYYVIGVAYEDKGDRVRSMLAYLTFLQREFNTTRCGSAAHAVIDQIFSGVTSDDDGATLTLSPGALSEGDELSTLDLLLSLLAVTYIEDGKLKEPLADTVADAVGSVIDTVAEASDDVDPESFVGKYLLPDVMSIHAAGLAEPYSYFVGAVAGIGGAAEWLDTHSADTDKLVDYFQMAAAGLE